ncbi:MAG: class I SAM-dependent methyltransferase [Candidatus Thiodiazotropha sp.]
MKLLIFPIDIDAGQRLAAEVRALGIPLVGASSIPRTRPDPLLGEIRRLPFVTEAPFAEQFRRLIEGEHITHVYTHHQGVWTQLRSLQQDNPDRYSFTLVQPDPYTRDWLTIADSLEWAERLLRERFTDSLSDIAAEVPAPPLKRNMLAGLHQQFLRIPGQCDLSKLHILIHIAPLLPRGDLVEIGSLYGRSAFAMSWLGAHYRIGNHLSIDPWSAGKLDLQDQESELINRDVGRIDFDKIFQGFLCHLALQSNLGYVRETSEIGHRIYLEAITAGFIETPEFGRIAIQGKIALLHIDANHGYRHVVQDIALWEPHVTAGGWVLLDDYVWSFGAGVKRAADELLARGGFDRAFVLGDTLVLRKSPVPLGIR